MIVLYIEEYLVYSEVFQIMWFARRDEWISEDFFPLSSWYC
jgi:hypothetical protein